MFYRSHTENRAQRLRRARPVIAMASVAFAIGAIVGANHHSSSAHALAARFVREWTRSEYAAMYSDIDSSSQQETSAAQFAAVYRRALRTATATSLAVAGKPRSISRGLVEGPAPAPPPPPVRHALAPLRAEGPRRRRRRRAHRLVARRGLPGAAPGRAAQPPHRAAAAREDPGQRRERARGEPRNRHPGRAARRP